MSERSDRTNGPVPAPDLNDEAASRLRRLDQRYTRARRALVGVLASAEAPLSIPQLLARDRALAQSSAYRNLAVLEQAGVVHRIVGSDEFSRYELAEDLTRRHHHHLICSQCGEVQDFTAPARIENDLDRALQRVAARYGFDADHHRLDLVGTCANCR
jgi:Fur family ferric uptake transcriptional regulator